MATTKTNTAVAVANERDAVAAEITQQLLAALNAPKTEGSFIKRAMQYAGDQLAEAKEGFAYITAGLEAADNNYRITRESERARQQMRTAEKMAQLVERQLKLKGL